MNKVINFENVNYIPIYTIEIEKREKNVNIIENVQYTIENVKYIPECKISSRNTKVKNVKIKNA